MKRYNSYNKELKNRTKELRSSLTESEKKLWFSFLKEINSSRFRILKQKIIDNFIVDFYIPKFKLIIEIDWEIHFTDNWIKYDIERTSILKWLWLKVIRFTNNEIMTNFIWVCKMLELEFRTK